MNTPQVEFSKCCDSPAYEDYKQDPRDKYEDIDIWKCSKCDKECQIKFVCAYCKGDKILTIPAHQAYSESRGTYIEDDHDYPCECTWNDLIFNEED